MNVDQAITRLINRARSEAIEILTKENRGNDAPATQANLNRLASEVRSAILRQAARGEWATWGVTKDDDLVGLTVAARLNRSLVGPRILIEEDFKNTPLRLLVVENRDLPS